MKGQKSRLLASIKCILYVNVLREIVHTGLIKDIAAPSMFG